MTRRQSSKLGPNGEVLDSGPHEIHDPRWVASPALPKQAVSDAKPESEEKPGGSIATVGLTRDDGFGGNE